MIGRKSVHDDVGSDFSAADACIRTPYLYGVLLYR
jgi:hypothetical protein